VVGEQAVDAGAQEGDALGAAVAPVRGLGAGAQVGGQEPGAALPHYRSPVDLRLAALLR
jgi:hypothetical protein